MFDEKNTKKFIYTGNRKCRAVIESCITPEQLDTAIDMCNSFGKAVCNILNSSDYKFVSRKWNIHRPWCKRVYDTLNSTLSEIDSFVSERRAYIDNHPVQGSSGTLGFK